MKAPFFKSRGERKKKKGSFLTRSMKFKNHQYKKTFFNQKPEGVIIGLQQFCCVYYKIQTKYMQFFIERRGNSI